MVLPASKRISYARRIHFIGDWASHAVRPLVVSTYYPVTPAMSFTLPPGRSRGSRPSRTTGKRGSNFPLNDILIVLLLIWMPSVRIVSPR
jgi:hypothetical protein